MHCFVLYIPFPQTNRVFQTEATKHFETEFPLGTKCQFRGAAIPNTCLGTPDACPFRCVDPVDIKYDVTSCEVEGEQCINSSYTIVREGSLPLNYNNSVFRHSVH